MKEKQLRVWRMMLQSLHQNIPVMLLFVLESHGSSRGRQGFFMAVNKDGVLEGSIGGGIMEHKFVEMAKDKLRHNEYCNNIYKQIHDKSSSQFQSGMICSGEQTNFLYRVKGDEMEAINAIVKCIESHSVGKLRLTPEGVGFSSGSFEDIIEFTHQDENEKDWFYEGKVGFKNNLYIIGAGHCSLALSEVMSKMDFRIYLYEDRSNLDTYLENNFAHNKTIVSNYAELNKLIPSGDNTYIVVMTIGYRTDDIVVRSLLDKEFRYFGLLGSQKKIDKMFSDYLAEGISEDVLKRIHAPIGVQINSQTPEEIAVSIAAEIIAVKNAATI